MRSAEAAKDTSGLIEGSVGNAALVNAMFSQERFDYVFHLAAYAAEGLSHFIKKFNYENNLIGSVNLINASVNHEVECFVFTSSIAVYGSASDYPPGPLADDAPLSPVTLYGVTKEANEGWAAIYWQDYQIPSVGLRPFFVYGPGRAQGVSSTPTKAMAAAAVGRPYHISFGGTDTYQHADDVARVFIQAARTMPKGAPVYNLGGTLASVSDVIAAIERAAPESAGTITANTEPLFTPDGVEGKAIESLLGPIEWRPLVEGVGDTIEVLRAASNAGRLDADRAVN